jgi:TPR repeat protein
MARIMNSPKAVWSAAALIVLATVSAVYFGVHRQDGAGVVGQYAAANAPPPLATVDKAHVAGAERPLASSSESKPDTHDLPKSPVDHPFEFIRSLAKAAYEGNSDAQYRIAKELDRCEMTLSLVRKSIDPEEEIWSLPQSWTPKMKEAAIAEYHRCSRLLREDPFVGLPLRAHGYKADYWLRRAIESGQPVALVQKGVAQLLVETGDSVESKKLRVEAREMLMNATMSGNPDALLMMGFKMRSSESADRKLQGAAWMLAACRAGADCGSDSAIVPMWMCDDAQCPPGMDVETMLGAALSPPDLAQAHARYERIAAALGARDVEAISAQIGW